MNNNTSIASVNEAETSQEGVLLRDVCVPTEVVNPTANPDSTFIYIDISSVDNLRKRIVSPQRIKGSSAPSRARKLVRAGDIILSTTRPNLNAVAKITPEFDGQVCSTGFCVLRAGPSLDSDYLFFFVQSPLLVERLTALVAGSLYPAVTDGEVLEQELLLPPLTEQHRIAKQLRAQFAALEAARTAAETQLLVLNRLKTKFLGEAFGQIAQQNWPMRELGDVGAIASGITLGRKPGKGSVRTVPYLRVANVKDGRLDLAEMKTVEATEDEINAFSLQFGDLLLTEGGDPDKLGRGTFWETQIPVCIHQNHIFRVRVRPGEFDPAFLAFQFGSTYGKAYFLAHAKQTTGIASINRSILSRFPLLCPPLDEQRRIAPRLRAQLSIIAAARTAAEGQLAAINQLPAAYLREAFNST